MAHREGIRDYLKNVKLHGVVMDWGCGTKPMKNYLKGNCTYIGIDKLKHVNADVVVDFEEDIHILDDYDADIAFCIEVIEHVWRSDLLLSSIYCNLKDGGVFYFSQPFMYKTHKEDDRHRYTHHGLLQLLSEIGFTDIVITPTVGDLEHADGFVGSARK